MRIPSILRRSNNESTEERPPSRSSHRSEASTTEDEKSIAGCMELQSVMIDVQRDIYSVAFLNDGKHVASRSRETKLRRWRKEDGTEAGTIMNTEDIIRGIAVAKDGKWTITATDQGLVEVWDAETNKRVSSFQGQSQAVYAVDASPDGTKIATGSADGTACVWSRETGERLLGPWEHNGHVVAVKFSPSARRIATATWQCDSIRIYDAAHDHLLFDVPIRVGSYTNTSLVWASNIRLFVLSENGTIHCLDASTGSTLTQWPIHSNQYATCIALASNKAFIAASAGSSVSFWDISTGEQAGPVVQDSYPVLSMTMSDEFDLLTCGDHGITLHGLYNILPPRYLPHHIHDAPKLLRELYIQLSESEQAIKTLRGQEEVSGDRIVQLEKSNQELRDELRKSQRERNDTIDTLHSQETSANVQIDALEKIVEGLRDQLAAAKHAADRERDRLNQTIDSLRVREEKSSSENDRFGRIVRIHEQMHQCESLYFQDRVFDAAESLLAIEDAGNEDIHDDKFLSDWFTDFLQKCTDRLEKIGNEAFAVENWREAVTSYAAVLSLSPRVPYTLLIKWVHITLDGQLANEALGAAVKFKTSRFKICHAVCDVLEEENRLTEAVECFRYMKRELPECATDDERVQWEYDFRERCAKKLVKLGDTASDTEKHHEAIKYYSDALSLEPADSSTILLKHGNELIEVDPSSHKGYEEKHVALHALRRYSDAFQAFQMMRSRVEQSPDPKIHDLRHQYIDVTPLIRQAVQQTLSLMPRILIDATTGRMYDKYQQAAMFEEHPIFDELRSSMTTRNRLDHTRIHDEVKSFYRYAMFSHRWDKGEPLLPQVQKISVYDLASSPANIKLQTLCRVVQALGYRWVWSDTCCIDKENNVVLQESLVAMFSWYRGSSLTLVYLRGVWSDSQEPGDLEKSVWNTRVWTYQEYVAAETVRFYTEDWKPYLNLEMFNHKESPAIVTEMEHGSRVLQRQLAVLRPGLDRVREKLSLASTRETTFVEDIAYSLLGIFHASIPVIYGERYRAVGRLLEHVLTGSGDVSILAWTGQAGAYNSCLPIDLSVYHQVVPPHIPQPIQTDEMDNQVTALRSSFSDPSTVVMLYNHLRKLPPPFMASSRLRLSGILFHVHELSCVDSDTKSRIQTYHATTSALGVVEIKTRDDLLSAGDLVLVYPWIKPLFDQNLLNRVVGLNYVTPALRLVARLRRSFGALLLAPVGDMQYKRVATDCLIMTCIGEETELTELIDGIDIVDIK